MRNLVTMDRTGTWLRWARKEIGLLSMLLVLAGVSLGFIGLAEEVAEGETHRIDQALILALRNPADRADPLGPAWIEEAARDVTALGSVSVLSFAALVVIGYLAINRKQAAAVLVAASVIGGSLLVHALKLGFDRPRPDVVSHAAQVFTASFPSAHAAVSAVTYLTLGALLARVQPLRRAKLYVMAVAILLTVAVGLSRIYLGVHWPTDVLAGWCMGAAWSIVCWLAMRALQRHGEVEQPDPAPPGEPESATR